MRPISCLISAVAIAAIVPFVAHADECDSVLIPTIQKLKSDLRLSMSFMDVFEQTRATSSSSQISVNIPVPVGGGPPLILGIGSGQTNKDFDAVKRFTGFEKARNESFTYIISQVGKDKVKAWTECKQIKRWFYAFIEPKSIITGEKPTATLIVGFSPKGKMEPKTLKISAKGGTVEGKPTLTMTLDIIGELPLALKKHSNDKMVINLLLVEAGIPDVVVFPKPQPPLSAPRITFRVTGNLQNALVNEIKFQPNFSVSKGVKFDSSNWQLTIEQLVNNRLCASKVVGPGALGDMMNTKTTYGAFLKVGCQMDEGKPYPIRVDCFVDPIHPASCP